MMCPGSVQEKARDDEAKVCTKLLPPRQVKCCGIVFSFAATLYNPTELMCEERAHTKALQDQHFLQATTESSSLTKKNHFRFRLQTAASVAFIARASGGVELWRTALLKALRYAGFALCCYATDAGVTASGWAHGVQACAAGVGVMFGVGFFLGVPESKYDMYRSVTCRGC